MPKALPGFSGGKLPGRSKEETCKEEENDEEEIKEIKIMNEVTRGTVAGVLKEADAGGGGLTRNTASAIQRTKWYDWLYEMKKKMQ